MKKVYSVLVALMATTMSFAQVTTIATLSHDGEVSSYYGTVALQEAYAAAADGDVITLSCGSFAAVDINKALTIRGAGMQEDTLAAITPTIINGNFSINIPNSEEHYLMMEGLYHDNTITIDTLANASFVKNRLGIITCKNTTTSRMEKLPFVHCKVTSSSQSKFANISSASFINCYAASLVLPSGSTNYEFLNCVIWANLSDVNNSIFTNCIIYNPTSPGSYPLNSTNTANYCLGKSYIASNNIFRNLSATTNTYYTDNWEDLFQTYTGTYSDTETFELTDEAKTKYLGQDGSEVGMYGGNLPYDPIPTNPRITKFDVASKSTADGKLRIEIEVAAE